MRFALPFMLLLVLFLFLPAPVGAQSGDGQTGSDLYGMVRDYLREDGWNPSPIPGTNIIESGYEGDNGAVFFRVHVLSQKFEVVTYSILPNKAPRDRRDATMEFVTRANYGLAMGNFELDLSDGEVRFKTSIDVEGGRLTSTMLETLIYLNVLTMDMYLPGLNAVMFAGIQPDEALRDVKDELEVSRDGG